MKQEYKDALVQIGLAVFGVLGIVASYSSNPVIKHYAPIIGICSQPFWFYMTWTKRMWGAFFITFLYTGSWVYGIYNNFLR